MAGTESFYEVRWARAEDWIPAMDMVWKTFMKFEGKEYSEEGIKNFHEFITDDTLYCNFLKGTYQMMVAKAENRIVGVGTLRNRNHLSLLFVDELYHHQGVGTTLLYRLCDYLKSEEGEKRITVQAAPYAIGFYHTLGFTDLAPEIEMSGIRVTSMEKIL